MGWQCALWDEIPVCIMRWDKQLHLYHIVASHGSKNMCLDPWIKHLFPHCGGHAVMYVGGWGIPEDDGFLVVAWRADRAISINGSNGRVLLYRNKRQENTWRKCSLFGDVCDLDCICRMYCLSVSILFLPLQIFAPLHVIHTLLLTGPAIVVRNAATEICVNIIRTMGMIPLHIC